MPVFYVESSALFKRYRTERGTDVVNAVFSERTDSDLLVTSQIVTIEMESTAARGLRGRALNRRAYGAMLRSFAEDLGNIVVLPLYGPIVLEAAQVARQYALRALDAIHLASAVRVSQTIPVQTVLVAADGELIRAGEGAGLAVLNPEAADAMQALERIRR